MKESVADERDGEVPEPGKGVVRRVEGQMESNGGEGNVGRGKGDGGEDELAARAPGTEVEQAAADQREIVANVVQQGGDEAAKDGERENEISGHR